MMAFKSRDTKSKKVAWAPGHVFESGQILPAPQSPNPLKGPLHGLWREEETSLNQSEIAKGSTQTSKHCLGHARGRGDRRREPIHVDGWAKPIYDIDAVDPVTEPEKPRIVRDQAYYDRIYRERWIPREEDRGDNAMTPSQEQHLIETMWFLKTGRPYRRRGKNANGGGQGPGSSHGQNGFPCGRDGAIHNQANAPVQVELKQGSAFAKPISDPSKAIQPATEAVPVNLTPWLKFDFEHKGRNLLMTLPGELRNRIYDLIFVKGNIRINTLTRAKGLLTYELQQKDGKWEGPVGKSRKEKNEAAHKRAARNRSRYHRIKSENPEPYYQAGGIAALMVCCKAIYLETAPMWYSNFTWSFSSAGTMKTFINRMSHHALSGIHTVSLEHATYGIPLETNFYGYKRLHDEQFLNLCNNTAQALVNLQSFTVCLHINELAPAQLDLKAPWVMPLLAFAHRNLQHARVKFLTTRGYGFDDEKLKAFANVVKRELLGNLPTSHQITKVLEEASNSSLPQNAVEKVHTIPENDERIEGFKAKYDSGGHIVGDNDPHRLLKILPSFDDDGKEDHGPPSRAAEMEYAFTSSVAPRFAKSHQG